MNDKAQIITMLREEFNRWEELLNRLSEEQITAPNFINEMTVKDVVAHLTVWQQISVERLEAARYSRHPEYSRWHPEFGSESEEELTEINAWIYKVRREQSWSALHQEWQERFLRFLKLAEATPENDLLEVGKYSWLKEYPLSAVLLGSYEHHAEHLEPLLALLHSE
jgi:hypothetical protein